MKRLHLILLVALFAASSVASAASVRGYVKPSSGKYVAPHQRSNPNGTTRDNYNSAGNYNPNKMRYTK